MSLDNQNIIGADAMLLKLKKAKDYLMKDAAEIVGKEAITYFKNNFDNESFDGNKWASRQTKRKGTTNNQKVLSASGDLRKSIVYRVEGTTAIVSSDLVYAQIHNEGLQGRAWGKHSFTMPKRQFIGESEELNNKITTVINDDLNKILNL